MRNFVWPAVCATLLIAGCDEIEGGNSAPSVGFASELPEEVRAMAAPYQDLTSVRINPSNGCYVYRYAGPVETTFLPLRTVEGRPICTQRPEGAQSS